MRVHRGIFIVSHVKNKRSLMVKIPKQYVSLIFISLIRLTGIKEMHNKDTGPFSVTLHINGKHGTKNLTLSGGGNCSWLASNGVMRGMVSNPSSETTFPLFFSLKLFPSLTIFPCTKKHQPEGGKHALITPQRYASAISLGSSVIALIIRNHECRNVIFVNTCKQRHE